MVQKTEGFLCAKQFIITEMNDLHLYHSHFKTQASNNNNTMHQNNDKNTLFGILG